MKKQIYTFIGILIVLTVSSVSAVYAQSATTGKSHVPFDFSVRNQTIAAGDYMINRQDDSGSAWTLRGNDNRQAMFLITSNVESKRVTDKGKLTFRRYGNKYFLAAIETSVYKIELGKSRTERRLEKQSENNRLAVNNKNGNSPEIVFVEIAM